MSESNAQSDLLEESSKKLQVGLEKLASWEGEMHKAEIESDIIRIKKAQPLYYKRREILKEIEKFWYIILAENDDFVDYISPDDLKYLEYIDDVYVNYPIVDETKTDKLNPRNFNITIGFGENPYLPKQSITKEFKIVIDENGEESLKSTPVSIQWPQELKKINPQLLKENSKGKQMSSEDKKKYRLGMKSIFSWFSWTGSKPGKEFRNGEDLANLIANDLFVNALKYYTIALSLSDDQEDDEEDTSEGEELDLSDLEDLENGNNKRSLEEVKEEVITKKRK
ncbi:hypothetical protein KGF54_000048 [Candida jiufengensis]|uniref:uncharacterized protein n=1 Tax=Candida jiufengensis TaxID=497108 RepID=UPI0022252E0B|nr:uncharacterized protein KGF54_000048 [Candida jiufengensis]KAI5957120.1 hypothetical protein KGF54_000048 [Candida jiufengensis]